MARDGDQIRLQRQVDGISIQDVNALQAGINAAQSDAITAITNAATAQSTANTGVTNAATAQTTANNAQTTANAALPNTGGSITGSVNITQNSNGSQALHMEKTNLAPTGVDFTSFCIQTGKGDNTTFKGVGGMFMNTYDDVSVNSSNKGVLYGLNIGCVPLVSRNNVPVDDADCLVLENGSPNASKATDCIYIGHNSNFTGGAREWVTILTCDANGDYFLRSTGDHNYGLQLGNATVHNAAIQLPIQSGNASPTNGDMWTDGTNLFIRLGGVTKTIV